MDSYLQRLAESPINTAKRASKVFLPQGTRPAPREVKQIDPKAKAEAKAYREREAGAKVAQLLDYYATTSVPFDRIAEHMKLSVEQVTESMKLRGRVE